ncbi:MAG TPA: NADPH-dependent F420 reductase [Dehalococcoidia bacterium]|nr:NADPH-dependent F420 reductase [Dehalococcoidia bacterium]
MKLAFIGGTGEEGMGLAYRLVKAGHQCTIGSRSLDKAQAAVNELHAKDAGLPLFAATNEDATSAADAVIVTTPYAALAGTIPPLASSLEGKITVSTVVPMSFEGGKASLLTPRAGSAAQELQELAPQARVAAAFQNLSAKKLLGDRSVEADVVTCADDDDAKQQVIALANAIEGVRGVDGGALANAQMVEAITVLLVSVNRNYKARAGIRITGIKL